MSDTRMRVNVDGSIGVAAAAFVLVIGALFGIDDLNDGAMDREVIRACATAETPTICTRNVLAAVELVK